MNLKMAEIIDKKRLNQALSKEEIDYAVNAFLDKSATEAQMSALLMAICLNGMKDEETFALVDIMLHSGEVLQPPKDKGIFVDKHSTGGVSDSTTLIIAPIIACSGLKMLKMSGRSLGHTGGTIDKLGSFKGYEVEVSLDEAQHLIEENGAAVIAQTSHFVPADKYIYKLRDETSTVQSIPLMASSIMSKKLACGNDIIVLDVKCGNGAFMNSLSTATDLAELMVKIGTNAQKKIVAVVSDMNEPLGSTIGDELEIKEVISVLEGKSKGKLYDLSVYLAAQILSLGKELALDIAKKEVIDILESGRALQKLKDMVKAQHGELDMFDEKIYHENNIYAESNGYVKSFNTKRIGEIARAVTSAGGKGIICHKKIGDLIQSGDKLFSFIDHDIMDEIKDCIEQSSDKQEKKPVVLAVIDQV